MSNIRKKQTEESRAMEAKDCMLAEMRVLNEELRKSIATKTEEIKTLIDRVEGLKREKETEVSKVVLRQKLMEAEMRALIQEHDRQKQVAQEKLKTLSELFVK